MTSSFPQFEYRGPARLGGAKVQITKGTWSVISVRDNGDVSLMRRGVSVIVKSIDWIRDGMTEDVVA
jgi:hypothetical protein